MNRELKILTYNIDGLPESLDLNDLPCILKPITWIYKLIKKTTIIKINDNKDTSNKMKQISKFLLDSNADIIGVQEDFNYHNELTSELYDTYSWGTYLGGFDISKIFSSVECLTNFPLPRFKADGMNLFTKIGIHTYKEEIINWNKSSGYVDHANDLLTHKGFRFYNLNIDNIELDVYIVHMDADFYHPEKCPDVIKDIEARKSQIEQLLSYIFERYYACTNPAIIIGDTNSYDKYNWDKENIEYFIKNINYVKELNCQEAIPNNYNDCDRIFFINHSKGKYKLKLKECHFDKDISLSDHKPLEATFTLTENN